MSTHNEQNKRWKKRFYTIAVGQAVSYIGSSAVQFALIWWLAKETGSALMLSLAGLFAYLPQTLLAPFAGVWIDRLKRKTVMIAADLFTGFVSLAFAVVFFLGSPPYWAACVVLGIRAIGGVFHGPALQAAIPLLVPEEKLITANSVNEFILVGSYMLGPIIGAAMFAALPMEFILLTDLLGAMLACTAVMLVKIPETKHELQGKKHFLLELKEGMIVFLDDKKLFFLTIFSMLVLVFIMPLSSLYPLIISGHFNGTEWHLSIIQVIYGVGMMSGAAVVGGMGNKIKNKLAVSILGLFVFSVTAFFCGILPPTMIGLWIFAGICLVMGAGNNMYNVPFYTYIQETIPNEKQGRVFSLLNFLMSFTIPLGLLIAGPVAEILGVTALFIIAGGASTVITGVCMVAVRKNTGGK
jgi:DHA3 family macrolide efflux protein-like MFS transporter